MYELNVSANFAAAHYLRNYEGKCRNLHGHNWKIVLTAAVDTLDEIGMGIDFNILKKCLKEAVDELDHTNLNELFPFEKENPTAENIAKWIFYFLDGKITGNGAKLKNVTVWESETSWVNFKRE